MGNSGSRNANNVPEQYTRPAGLYTGQVSIESDERAGRGVDRNEEDPRPPMRE